MSIVDLKKRVEKLSKDKKELFDRFFTLDTYNGPLKIPDSMKPWVIKQFGSIASVKSQKIVRISNNFTSECTLYNELRAKRPLTKGKAEISFDNDPFSKPKKTTPEDVFGRVKGKHSISASNIAKYDKWHGLVIFDEKNPLNFTQASIQDSLEVGVKWLKKAHKEDPKAEFPFLLWHCLWKSAASVTHGHMQLLLTRKNHYPGVELLNGITQCYPKYFKDLVEVHKNLGLSVSNNVIVNLVPKKEKEVMIISTEINKSFASNLFKVLKCFRDDLGVQSFTIAIYAPPLTSQSNWKGFPVIARVIDRGPLDQKTADIGVQKKLKKYF